MWLICVAWHMSRTKFVFAPNLFVPNLGFAQIHTSFGQCDICDSLVSRDIFVRICAKPIRVTRLVCVPCVWHNACLPITQTHTHTPTQSDTHTHTHTQTHTHTHIHTSHVWCRGMYHVTHMSRVTVTWLVHTRFVSHILIWLVCETWLVCGTWSYVCVIWGHVTCHTYDSCNCDMTRTPTIHVTHFGITRMCACVCDMGACIMSHTHDWCNCDMYDSDVCADVRCMRTDISHINMCDICTQIRVIHRRQTHVWLVSLHVWLVSVRRRKMHAHTYGVPTISMLQKRKHLFGEYRSLL